MSTRTKPFFPASTVTAILDNFRRSMTAAERYFDDNLLAAVEDYIKSSKTPYENVVLSRVAEGDYRFLYENGSVSFGVIMPTALKEYKEKYPLAIAEIKKDENLYKQAMLDMVEMDIKNHLSRFKDLQEKLNYAMQTIGREIRKDTGNIAKFLKQPFEERSTRIEETPTAGLVLESVATEPESVPLS